MRVDVLTLFPDAFAGPLDVSIIARARESGVLSIGVHDIREHALDRHRSVDDSPFGGGQGMVMRVDVLDRALSAVQALDSQPGYVVCLSPQGERLDDRLVRELAELPRLVLVCGRYEGFDQRFVDNFVDREISIGDYVLTGGELPAMVLVDSVARQLPGALGDDRSSADESFADGLLEHPQYTRPAEYRGWPVPDVLLGGRHVDIERWRAEQRIERTAARRPDLLTPSNALLPSTKRPKKLKGLRVRPATEEDIPAAALLMAAESPAANGQKETFESARASLLARLTLKADVFLVAEAGDRVVALLTGVAVGDRGQVDCLLTDTSVRRSGAGSALLEAATRQLGEQGCRTLTAIVPDQNLQAMALFESCGWARGTGAVYSAEARLAEG